MDDVWLRQEITVDQNSLVDDADAIAGQSDHAFDVVRMIVEGKLENDDVAAADRAGRGEAFRTRRRALRK